MSLLVALLGSPLLGPAAWRSVHRSLREKGWDVAILAPVGGSAEQVLSSLLAQLPEDRELVLVPHSNAGLYAGAVAAQRRVRAVVFVDAGIPDPDLPTPTGSSRGQAFLGGLADDDGLLPPWTSWWPEEDVAALFPDAATRAAVEAEQPRLPLRYFSDEVPRASAWQALPCGYLAFGETYAEEIARATAAGWPVARLDGRHLHMLVDPDAVAAEVVGLLEALAVEA